MLEKLSIPLALLTVLSLIAYNQWGTSSQKFSLAAPELTTVAPGTYHHRQSGEFLRSGRPVDAPMIEVDFRQAFQIMKYQVSRAEYARCIADGACQLTFGQANVSEGKADNRPVTGVSYADAVDYARWLSRKTGIAWRLPTDAEWAYAAGSRFFDDATNLETDPNDPSRRMLSKYKQSIELDREADPVVRPRGGFGANERGIFDMSGNVWEWTETCYQRSRLDEAGNVEPADEGNCGVRVVEGRHRSYMTFFVKDAKSGGCAVGTPPDYLGFRLMVQEKPALLSVQPIGEWLKANL